MKIFVTVGSMLPFDRLVRAVDAWAEQARDHQCFAQIGNSSFHPRHMPSQAMLSPAEYRERFRWCDLIISHVGMGTVITASELGKPLLILPRRVHLSEVTSAHQEATAKWLRSKPGICVIEDETELAGSIPTALAMERPQALPQASAPLLDGLRSFVAQAMERRT